MNWMNIKTESLRSAEFSGCDNAALGVWLRVLSFCCEQENSGRLAGAVEWNDRTWMISAGVTKAEVESAKPLLYCDGADYFCAAYPTEKEALVAANRKAGKRGGKASAQAYAQAHARPDAQAPARPLAQAPAATEGEGEGERKENKKGTEEEPPEDPTVAEARQVREEVEAHRAAIRADAKLLLEALNELTGKKFTPVDSHLNPIIARLNEPGVEPEECEKMLRRQVKLWKNDPKMSAHLVPSTLFRASNFQKYYDQRDEGVANGQTPLQAFYNQPVPGFTPLANPYDTQGGKRLMQ